MGSDGETVQVLGRLHLAGVMGVTVVEMLTLVEIDIFLLGEQFELAVVAVGEVGNA